MIKSVNNKNEVDIFNILRAIAIFLVFVCHVICTVNDLGIKASFPWYYYTPAWGGVWIFFILSGYLIGKGFYLEKYQTDFKSIINFIFRRFMRLAPIYYFFLLLIMLFVNPNPFFNLNILSLITFTNNYFAGGSIQTGALWFVSTIFQLYILAPLVYKFVFKYIKCKQIYFLIFIIFAGLVERLLQAYFKSNWYSVTYVNTLTNLDLFFGGFLLNALVRNKPTKVWGIKNFNMVCKITGPLLLITLIIINMFIYHSNHIWPYQYVFPTLYLLITLFIIWSYDDKEIKYYAPLTFSNMIKNPIKIIESLGVISFPLYVFHSTILQTFAKYLNAEITDSIHCSLFNIIKIDISRNTVIILSLTLLGFIFSIIWATIIYKTIEKPASKFKYLKLFNN